MKAIDGVIATRAVGATSLPLSHLVFARRAEEILRLVEQLRAGVGLREAINEAIERFVEDEAHPELRHFSQVIVMARRQALMQQQLDEDRESLHHGHLSHEENISTGHHYEMLRHEACSYNHLTRGLIEACGQYFSRDELMGWLTTMSQGRGQWAHAEVTGAVSEIALHAALQGLPELRGLRYATLAEDLRGYDFVASWQGELLTIDAKTGFYQPLSEQLHGHRHLEISVPHEAVKGFGVTRHGLDQLRREVRQALYGATGSWKPRGLTSGAI